MPVGQFDYYFIAMVVGAVVVLSIFGISHTRSDSIEFCAVFSSVCLSASLQFIGDLGYRLAAYDQHKH